jgi:hypothetical protein
MCSLRSAAKSAINAMVIGSRSHTSESLAGDQW